MRPSGETIRGGDTCARACVRVCAHVLVTRHGGDRRSPVRTLVSGVRLATRHSRSIRVKGGATACTG